MASPSVIRVRAVTGKLVPVPRQRGNVAQYCGRRIDHDAIKAKERDDERRYPIDDSSNATFHRDGANGVLTCDAIRRSLIEGDLQPADAVTAQWAGVPLYSEADRAPADAEWRRLADQHPN